MTSVVAMRLGMKLTPESFRNFVSSLGVSGPIIYILIFFVRPFFLIPSIALFIAGGLAFGPVWGSLYASFGAAVGGALAFLWARKMGHDYVMGKLKIGAAMIDSTRFRFAVVFILSLIPVMPVTVINYGAGLSPMTLKSYLAAHFLGLTPRAFAYGFFGSTLLEIGSPRFRAALMTLLILLLASLIYRRRLKRSAKRPS
ncbi:MAG: TVP38/TMEM64 family protein [Nitrospinota bacterium]|nr:TVP38/TMEM64 family protein [Nitrospinota bacterium]